MIIKDEKKFINYHHKRSDYKNIIFLLENNNNDVIILKGLRRIGKTVLLEQIFKDYKFEKLFIELEDNDNSNEIYNFLKDNYKKFKLIIIDEFTNRKNMTHNFMFLKDMITNSGTKIIISGSQSLALNNLAEGGLFGRCKVYNLFPCDYIDYNKITNNDFKEYSINCGFFYDNANHETIINNIVDDIYISIFKNNVDEDFFKIEKRHIYSSIIYILFLVSWETLNDLLTDEDEFIFETNYIYNYINDNRDDIFNYLENKHNISYNAKYVSIINEYLKK